MKLQGKLVLIVSKNGAITVECRQQWMKIDSEYEMVDIVSLSFPLTSTYATAGVVRVVWFVTRTQTGEVRLNVHRSQDQRERNGI